MLKKLWKIIKVFPQFESFNCLSLPLKFLHFIPTSLRGVQMKYWSNVFAHETDQNLSTFNKEEVDLKLPWSSDNFDSYQVFKLWHNKYLVTLKSH